MEKSEGVGYTIYKILIIPVFLMMVTLMACSKPPEDVNPQLPPSPPVNNTPSGEIQTFVLKDTLVGFNNGSSIKWLVTGTNNLTVVTFNGVKVSLYGDLETGPLKQTTQFSLAVNSGKKASITLKVADSVTTLLWGGGKRLKQTKAEVYIIPAGETNPKWVDIPLTAKVADQRILFNLNGSSQVIQLSSSQISPYDSGTFTANAAQTAFTWHGIVYTIVSLNNYNLVVTYEAPQSNGKKLLTRNTYQFE